MKWITAVDKSDLINKSADQLMKIKEMTPPEWANFVRTGAQKQRAPIDKNWWYKRAASILLKATDKGPIGVSKLRTEYGGKKRRGHKPAEFRKSSGNIIRKIMQQLEKSELLKQVEVGVHKGRVVTPKGMSLLNTVAKAMAPKKAKAPVVKAPAKEAKPKVEKAAKAKEVKVPKEKITTDKASKEKITPDKSLKVANAKPEKPAK